MKITLDANEVQNSQDLMTALLKFGEVEITVGDFKKSLLVDSTLYESNTSEIQIFLEEKL